MSMSHKPVVSYFFDNEIGIYHLGNSHPMKPLRVAITDELVQSYGLYPKMKVYVSSSPSLFFISLLLLG